MYHKSDMQVSAMDPHKHKKDPSWTAYIHMDHFVNLQISKNKNTKNQKNRENKKKQNHTWKENF